VPLRLKPREETYVWLCINGEIFLHNFNQKRNMTRKFCNSKMPNSKNIIIFLVVLMRIDILNNRESNFDKSSDWTQSFPKT
jgi:hypothetical protein